jgi:1,4-dihydroxy-2-naphthoyl-CoA hydrolase
MSAPIWSVKATLEDLNKRCVGTLAEALGMEFTEIGPDYLTARMPVDARTKQPYGLLHGGASAALAETLGSSASNLTVDPEHFASAGIEINANHLRSCTSGFVEGVARPLHVGRTTQVWDIKISQNGKLICASRLTVAIMPRKKQT